MDLAISGASVESVEANSLGRREKSFWEMFVVCIGANEFFSPEMWRAALMESVATACLVVSLTCVIIACLDSSVSDPKLLVPIAVFVIAFLFLIVTVPLTGGHMSPLFTLAFALDGSVTLARAAAYVVAQCLGSVLGFAALKAVMSRAAAERHSLGGCSVVADQGGGPGIGVGTALALEFACSFLVLFVGVTVALDPRRRREMGLAAVCGVVAAAMAMAVFVLVTVTGRPGYAGVGLNPARCLGTALLVGGELWDGHWVFLVGPVLACLVYRGFHLNLPKKISFDDVDRAR